MERSIVDCFERPLSVGDIVLVGDIRGNTLGLITKTSPKGVSLDEYEVGNVVVQENGEWKLTGETEVTVHRSFRPASVLGRLFIFPNESLGVVTEKLRNALLAKREELLLKK